MARRSTSRFAVSRARREETEKGNNAPFGCSLPRISRARRDSTYARADRNVSVYASTTPRVAAADQLILTAVGELRARTHLSRPSLRRREFSSPFRGAILAADRRRYLRARRPRTLAGHKRGVNLIRSRSVAYPAYLGPRHTRATTTRAPARDSAETSDRAGTRERSFRRGPVTSSERRCSLRLAIARFALDSSSESPSDRLLSLFFSIFPRPWTTNSRSQLHAIVDDRIQSGGLRRPQQVVTTSRYETRWRARQHRGTIFILT